MHETKLYNRSWYTEENKIVGTYLCRVWGRGRSEIEDGVEREIFNWNKRKKNFFIFQHACRCVYIYKIENRRKQTCFESVNCGFEKKKKKILFSLGLRSKEKTTRVLSIKGRIFHPILPKFIYSLYQFYYPEGTNLISIFCFFFLFSSFNYFFFNRYKIFFDTYKYKISFLFFPNSLLFW